mgnify:CR=1 FL=1
MPTIDLNFKNAIVTGREAYVDGYELVSTGKYATGLELKPDGVRVKSWQDDIVLRKADRSSFTWKGEVVTKATWNTGKTNPVYGIITVSEPDPVQDFKPFATKPRPTFKPGGHTIAANLDKPGMIVDGVDIVAGGSTIGPDGKAYESAGYGWQISADNCTIRNVRLGTFSEYAVYIRPGVKNALIENLAVNGGTNFEASIRNAGGQVTLRDVVIVQDHYGIDAKRSRTLIRGPGQWTIEDSLFAGGTVGCNPMARLNAGQDLGFGEFQIGRGSGNIETSEGGQILRPTLMMAAVQAAIDARTQGKPRREIVRAAIVAGLVRSASAPDIERLIDDTLWNRDRMLAQRSDVTFTRCKFVKSPDGVPARIEIQPGATVRFIDCEAPDGINIVYEWQYPDRNRYADRHATNTDWTLPGDVVRPAPKAIAERFAVAGKAYAVPLEASVASVQ